jgi:hypothetical protein
MPTIESPYLPGDPVRIANGEILGHVDTVSATVGKVRFCVAYWNSGKREEVWLEEHEVRPVARANTASNLFDPRHATTTDGKPHSDFRILDAK